MPTLYDCATAPSPRRARILLAEKGIAHESVAIELRSGEQFGAAYRAINPDCTLPAFVLDDGKILVSNAAITAWAEAARPEPPLLGRTPVEKAEVAHWNWRVEFEGLMAIAESMRNTAPAMKDRALPGPVDYAQIPELATRGLARLKHFFEVLDSRLASNAHVAGDAFSVADITAVVAVDFARIVRMKPGEEHPNILRWRAAMAQRPAMAL
jgi:glutathione S-transferase